ncbi:sulfite exporter TauE/SafE family protein [Aeromicrobium sp.]|uniref:sulfite exporter TauE/SafE family protein n=1 Tax=Aeromicrobium sp. TaxID=1871063 RepID=UPI003C57C8FF
MTEDLVIVVAGLWAGAINVLVGSGALVTFPTLLFLGYPPLVANVSNNIGVVAGGLSGIHGYRRELRPNRPFLLRLVPASVLGGGTGAFLLFVLPSESFETIVPVLVGLGVLMVVIGPAVQRRSSSQPVAEGRHDVGIALQAGVLVLGIYGGYFGAAQGVLLTGLMSLFLAEHLQRITAIKNVLATSVNLTAAVAFVVFAQHYIDWKVVGLIAVGSVVGAQLGARYGRRLSPAALRALIVVIGLAAIVKLVFFD